jgi:hypothetical protein
MRQQKESVCSGVRFSVQTTVLLTILNLLYLNHPGQ